ncbi:hypothetical protein AAHN97_19180 [Chitinophaga niabensis]|uniref:hypothetical protein n=1 Tax=Chitinophaga niabensis TaxID=536979 RepID=UPI0031BBAE86
MESFYKKVRLVFVPYLVLLVISLAAYSFFNWRFYLLHPSDHIQEAVMLVILPIGLAIVAVLTWLRPRLRLLTVPSPKTSPQFTLNILSIMAVAIPIILFQYLLLSATGDLRKVHAPSDIAKAGYAKYYSVEEFADLKKYAYIRFATTSANKGRTLIHHQYFAMPLIDKSTFANNYFSEDTSLTFMKLFIEGNFPPVWACMEYTFRIKKKENTREKEDEFIENCKKDFYQKGFSNIVYMDRLGDNGLQREYRKTIVKEDRHQELIILGAQFTPFEKRYDRELKVAIIGTLVSMASLLLVFVIFKWDEERLQAFENKNRIW